MTKRQEDFELVRGGGNVFSPIWVVPERKREQVRALLAASIIKSLDKRGLSMVAAQELTVWPHPSSRVSAG